MPKFNFVPAALAEVAGNQWVYSTVKLRDKEGQTLLFSAKTRYTKARFDGLELIVRMLRGKEVSILYPEESNEETSEVHEKV